MAQAESMPALHGNRIRILDPVLRQAFDRGLRRSSTLAALVTHLQQSDAIVYVARGMCRGRHVIGCVVSVHQQGRARYVRINLVLFLREEATALRRSPVHLAAQIGHELQHALEIAEDPSIVDARSLERAYMRIGTLRNEVSYETAAAIRAGANVLKEMAAYRCMAADHDRGRQVSLRGVTLC